MISRPKNRVLQKRAYNALRKAIIAGKITRPAICYHCNKAPKPTSDRRAAIQAHHEDYSRALDVVWLCAKCHRKFTRIAFGERHGMSKLRKPLVQAARVLVACGFSVADVAEFYGMKQTTLDHAIARRTWKHV